VQIFQTMPSRMRPSSWRGRHTARWEKFAKLFPFLVGQFMAADHPWMISQVDSADRWL